MYSRLVIYIIINLLSLISYSQTYKTEYPDKFNIGLLFYDQNGVLFADNQLLSRESTAFLFSIVAPEIGEYNQLSDYAQTRFLEAIYVNAGENYANFSIGQFQMKPTFATRLETMIEHDSIFLHYQFLCDSNISASSKRRNRINRLKTLSIQIIYLSLFVHIIKKRFPQIVTWPDEDRLKFISAAYNRGFHYPYAEIKRYEQIKSFPARTLGLTFSYANVSLEYYRDLKHR